MIQNISAQVARSDGASSPRQRGLDENTVVCLASCALMGLWGKPQAQVEAGASVSGVYSDYYYRPFLGGLLDRSDGSGGRGVATVASQSTLSPCLLVPPPA